VFGQAGSGGTHLESTIRTMMAAQRALLRAAALARSLGDVALAEKTEQRALQARQMVTRLSAWLPTNQDPPVCGDGPTRQ
jgi:hypothetical protein